MSTRPLTFGIRFRDKEKGRTLRIEGNSLGGGRYVVEDSRRDRTNRRDHPSLSEALKDFAATWRGRLN